MVGVSRRPRRLLEGEINVCYATPATPNLAWIVTVTHKDSVCRSARIKMSQNPRKRQRTQSRSQSRTVTLMNLPRQVQSRPVRAASKGELKGVDTDLTSLAGFVTTVNTNDDILVLNLVQQGTGSFNRVGRKIYLQSVRLNMWMRQVAQNNLTSVNWARIALVWDRQPTGVLASYDAIFANTDQTGTDTPTLESSLRYDNTDRFKVLMDRRHEFQPGFLQSMNLTTDSWILDEFVSLKGLETVYNATTSPAVIADISSGALLLVCRAFDAANSVISCTLGKARLRYTD